MIGPFVGLFGVPQLGAGVIELHSLVALLVYALVGWLVGRLIWLLSGTARSAVVQSTGSVEQRVD
jgi:hypothetical protein